MEDLRAYVLSVTAAAILCGLINLLLGSKGTVAAIVKLLSGIVMAAVVIHPLGELVIGDMDLFLRNLEMEAQNAVSMGAEMSREELSQRIQAQTEAYILDKAEELELELTVEVILNQEELPVPAGVVLSGPASPSAKSSLQTWISRELGIPREEQTWT